MGNAVVTGTVDLASLEVTSSDGKSSKFAAPLSGDLRLNGVLVSLLSDSVDSLVRTVNRFTPQTTVTAAVGSGSTVAQSSSAPPVKYLTLTSPEDMRVDGDAATLTDLGLVGGLTLASSSAAVTSVSTA